MAAPGLAILSDFKYGFAHDNLSFDNSSSVFTNVNSLTFTPGLLINASNYTTANTNKYLKSTNLFLTPSEMAGNWTISIWVWQDTYVNDTVTIGWISSTTGGSFKLVPQSSLCTGQPAFIAYDGSSKIDCFGAGINRTQWTMLTVKRENSTLITYINGIQTSATSRTYSTTSRAGATSTFGVEEYNNVPTPGSYFSGMLDAAYVYTRSLPLSDIQDLYNARAGKQYPFTQATSNSVTFALFSPLNYTYSFNTSPPFAFNISSIVGNWNFTLLLNGTSYGVFNNVSTPMNIVINSSAIPSGKEYLWWINATDATNTSKSNITEKRLLYVVGASTGQCVAQIRTCTFASNSIALGTATGCI